MKTILSLSSLFIISIFFISCVKHVDVINTPPATNSITGTWYVSNASVNNGNGWANYNADLPGVFNFYNDGTAQYSDNLGNMQGYWNSNFVYSEYYDANGNYRNDGHNNFKINVTANNGGYVYLNFDDISFSGRNTFIATYYDGKTLESYTFMRY